MSKVNKVCEESEFWGSKKTICHYELEELSSDELFIQIADAVNEGLDYIPEEFEYIHIECLDAECWDTEEITFNVRVKDYLSDEDIEELENMIKDEE